MSRQVFRSKVAWIFGWAWLVFAAWNVWDLVAHGSMPSALIAGCALGVITVLVVLLALRPAIQLEEGGVRVRNPLRNAFIPWNAVGDVIVTNAIIIESGHETVRCWTPQATARERAKAANRASKALRSADTTAAEQAAAKAVGARTHADWVALQITETSAMRRDDSSGEAVVTWSPWALAALAAGSVLLVVLVIAAAA